METATMSVEEFAKALGVGRVSAYRAVKAGRVKVLRVSTIGSKKPKFRVPRSAIAEALADLTTFERLP